MSASPRQHWLRRHGDLLYRLILFALVGLWILFPPQARTQTGASAPSQHVQSTQ